LAALPTHLEDPMIERPSPSAGEVRALAHQLLSWADHLSTRLARGRRELSEEDQQDLLITVAEAMRGTRRVRSRIFPDVPLGNASWDVLLDLFIRELNGHRTSLAQIMVGDELPVATVNAAIDTLVRCGLVDRAPPRAGSSESWLTLTPRGKQGMFELLQEIAGLVRMMPASAEASTAEA
jgi:DNA-binding MarR family transcriptional regulator